MGHEHDIDRRRFLALMSASAALAAAGCGDRGDRGDIVPYLKQPDGATIGTPRFYSTMLRGVPGAPPVVATTREGRVVKLEGNPDHPASLGTLGAFGQAATFSLYDPDRVRAPRDRNGAISWARLDQRVRTALTDATNRGAAILVFVPALVSPTERALLAELRTLYPSLRIVAVETFHAGEVIAGWHDAFGFDAAPAVRWRDVDVALGIEPDFLDGSAADQRAWFDRRRPDDARGMARLWVVEGSPTLTGTNADHRLAVRPSMQRRMLAALLHDLAIARRLGPLADDGAVARALLPFELDTEARRAGIDPRVAHALAADLVAHRGRSAIVAGAALPSTTHVIVAALNATLGNVGATIVARQAVAPVAATAGELEQAIEAMRAGRVAVAIDLGTNPRYALGWHPAFNRALDTVPFVVSAVVVADETSAAAHCIAPATHDLEAWGDADVHDGVLTLQQPAMRPLFEARQREDMLLRWMRGDGAPPYRDYLRTRWEREVYPAARAAAEFGAFWRAALQDGFVPLPPAAAASRPIATDAVEAALGTVDGPVPSGVDVILAPSPHVWDGRFANNGWLQELPHPVTTHVWGNGAVIGVATAARLGCADGDLLSVRVGDRSVTVPAIVEPGGAVDVVRLELGHGRSDAGRIGSNVGANAGVLRAVEAAVPRRISPWIYTGATIARAGGRSPIARSQRYPRSERRPLAVEATLAEYGADRRFVDARIVEGGNVPSPGGWTYTAGPKWAMVIDLSRCDGCNACVAACSAENNVPVVGVDQVRRERQMHWVRIDRYYDRADDGARVTRQPVLCQHCDNAPCENVCPVAATVHTADGLNQMTYNRCVGTRYCANNCPYKVRRFNFLDYQGSIATPAELRMSPEVTVRSRGVMEKCTFCVQRLRAAQRVARREGRRLVDGEATTACAQSCPTGAIVFGDLNDPGSGVRALVESVRGYRLLGQLGTKPSVIYLAKVRNPSPDVSA